MANKCALVLFAIIFASPAVHAQTPLRKLERGIVNVGTAPVEIPKEIRAHWIKGSQMTDHISAWLFAGLVKGIIMTPVRLVSGAWDILTFPIEVPQDYAPLLKPDLVFDDWPKRKVI